MMVKKIKDSVNNAIAIGRLYTQYQKEFLARTEEMRAEMRDRYASLWASGYFHGNRAATTATVNGAVVDAEVVDETEFAN